jgi:uncharacterized protein YuzB (UPF0349 family)
MYKLIKNTNGTTAIIDSDFDLGIMLTLCHLNRQVCPEGLFSVVDGNGSAIWPMSHKENIA